MSQYSRSEAAIGALKEKYKQMEERDVSFKNYREKQEAFKAAEIKLKYDFDNDGDPSGFKNMLKISQEQDN